MRSLVRRAVAASACAALLAGCRDATTVPDLQTGDVVVTRVAGGVKLENGTARPVAYAVWNRGWLALLGPCGDPVPACVRLPVGAGVTVADRDIDGWAPGTTEALVRWWHVEPDGAGGFRAGTVHEQVVKL